jgi:hypothetical protein
MHAVFCSPFVRIGPPGHPSQEKSPEDDTKPVYMSYPHLLSAKGGGGGAERGRKRKRTPEAEARGPLPGVACGASALPFVPALGTENCKQSSCCCASRLTDNWALRKSLFLAAAASYPLTANEAG